MKMYKFRLRLAEHVVRTGEVRNSYTLLVGQPGRKRPLGRPRRWQGNRMGSCGLDSSGSG